MKILLYSGFLPLTILCIGSKRLHSNQQQQHGGHKMLETVATQDFGKKTRMGKLFSMFSLVNFPNDECTSSDSECGTCMTASECSGLKGYVSGSCAQGFGGCCVLYLDTCGGTISNNRTYIRNPGYSSTYTTAGTCTWTLAKCATNICQMRLDFDVNSVSQPDSKGICNIDYFQGTPARTGRATPKICGENAGQHMYVDAGANSDSSATFALVMTGNTARTWKFKVSMVECNSLQKPPAGCLQYHTGTTGTVRSFNYQDSTAYEHLQDQSYNTCIRQEKGYCKIGWKQSDDGPDTFKPGRGVPTTAAAFTSLNSQGCDTNAQADFVIIPNGSDGGAYNSNCAEPAGTAMPSIDKFCGGQLTCIGGSTTPAEVISNVRPFSLGVYFNNVENAANNNRGFKLNYRQVAC